uniref:Putative site-specific DNA-methyltransferase n=1 Tax=Clostridium perfringens TaxID=1502 RepID=A0A4Y5T4A0_CLOPF|nr:putative site-specific DNA-methyltransferase [Clostridium perfringens]
MQKSMLKPPITRLGGKSKLRKEIISMMPDHVCYVEPFFGAGWVYFGKEKSKIEVINDIENEIPNLFKIIKYHAPEMKRLLSYEISGRSIFDEYKNATLEHLTDIQRAIRFMYLITQSFGGQGNHYGYGTNTLPSQKIFDCNLDELRERLKNTYIENLDFQKIIEKYDREYTLFFLDPPYYGTAGYEAEFGIKEQLKLRDILKNIKGKFILTINDCEETRNWYKDFNIKEVEVHYSVSRQTEGRKRNKELIITNY